MCGLVGLVFQVKGCPRELLNLTQWELSKRGEALKYYEQLSISNFEMVEFQMVEYFVQKKVKDELNALQMDLDKYFQLKSHRIAL